MTLNITLLNGNVIIKNHFQRVTETILRIQIKIDYVLNKQRLRVMVTVRKNFVFCTLLYLMETFTTFKDLRKKFCEFK